MICEKCHKVVSVLLIDFSRRECAYCTTRRSVLSEEKAREIIELGEKAFAPSAPQGGENE